MWVYRAEWRVGGLHLCMCVCLFVCVSGCVCACMPVCISICLGTKLGLMSGKWDRSLYVWKISEDTLTSIETKCV